MVTTKKRLCLKALCIHGALVVAALFLAYVMASALPAPVTRTAFAQSDFVRLDCRKEGDVYKVSLKYNASGRRVLLCSVEDNNRKNTRIFRRLLNKGSNTITWTGTKKRYGVLYRACTAMYKSTDRSRALAWDCDNF